MDISSLPMITSVPKISAEEIKAAPFADVRDVNRADANPQPLITITKAPSPEGYGVDELYSKNRSVEAFEHVSQADNSIMKSSLEHKLKQQNFQGYGEVSGLLGQMKQALTSGESEVQQVSSKSLFNTRIIEFNPVEHTERIETRREKILELQFELKTEQGDVVTFNLLHDYSSGELAGHAGSYAQKNIELTYSIDGELNQDEIEAIDRFAQSLDQQLSRVERGKEIDFKKLDIFADSTIAEVDVSLQMGAANSEVFKLAMTNNNEAREIHYKQGAQKIDLTLDKTGLLGSKPNAQQAIDELLKSLEDGVSKSKDFTGKGRALVDAARNLFSHNSVDSELDTTARLGYSVTSGLPDFTIDYSNAIGNGASEQNLVDISADQKTRIKQEGLMLEVQQDYNFELQYQYVKPLPHLDFATQDNHIQVNGHEVQSRRSVLSTNEQGELTAASISKAASQEISEKEYREGELVRHDVDSQVLELHQDVIAQLAVAEEKGKLLLIDGILKHLEFDRPA